MPDQPSLSITHLLRGLALSLALAALAGCTGMVVQQAGPARVILWPEPPAVPRISFVGTLSRPQDMGITEGALAGLLRYLAGRPDTPMVSPHGITVDAAGRLYVVDNYLKKVHVFDQQGGRYRLIPAQGPALVSPIGVAVDDRRGRVYVTDSAQAVIRVYDRDTGASVGEIRGGDLGRPTGVVIDPRRDELLVVDTVNAGILRYALSDHSLMGILGQEGVELGRFHAPTHLALTPEGNLLVTDALNFRIQEIDARGRFVRAFGMPGDSPGHFARPKGVAVDSHGNIHVVDALFDNVQVFDREGRLLMAYGRHGSEPGEFWLPSGIWIDAHDRIYVADSYNKRVQIFQYLKDGELP